LSKSQAPGRLRGDAITDLDQLLNAISGIAAAPFEQAVIPPPAHYTSPALTRLEEERIFRAEWQCIGRTADIPAVGDYITYIHCGQPVFCIRGKRGAVRTFANVCRHRMMELLRGSGTARRIVCPYHGWVYDLSGRLSGATHESYFTNFDKAAICLPEIRTEVWQGFVFITLNGEADGVAARVRPLDALIDRFQVADYVPIVTEDSVWDTNWKLLTENYMESYHLPFIHKGTVGGFFPVEDCTFPEEAPAHFTYSTFTKSDGAAYGRAHPDNARLEGEWRYTNILPTIFPSHMFTLAPDYMWYLSLAPQGPGQVRIRYGASLAPEVVAAMTDWEAETAAAAAFLDTVNNEDRHVVEGAYRGACAPLTAPGPIHPLERAIHHFIIYLAGRLTGDGGKRALAAAE
jgi:phenylpropionate dioxygenase-like ring-hydroxylating dioxygenase large terminal subunit